MNPLIYEFSEIDGTTDHRGIKPINDFFTLFDFSAKWDIVPTMLTQVTKELLRVLWAKQPHLEKIS